MSVISEFNPRPIFYFFKQPDNEYALECSVVLMPLHSKHICGYTFILTAYKGNVPHTATFENATSDREIAERIFDCICINKTVPSELKDVVKQFVSTR